MNILITSAGRRSYLVRYFREALAGDGLVHAGNSVWSTALQAADKGVITPLIHDSCYIDFLLDYCMQNQIRAILSVFEIDLPVLAKSRERFQKQGIKVLISDYETTLICNDKWKSYNFFTDCSIYTPQTFLNIENVLEALNQGTLQFPLIIKPRWGMGSIGLYEATNVEELKILFKRVKKDIFGSYLSYASDKNQDECVIIQEKLQGQEYGLDVVNDLDRNCVATWVIKARSMRSGETVWAITEKNRVLEELGVRLSRHLGHIANLNVDCFICYEKPYVLEMNCRFGGHYPFFHLAGANLPMAIIKWLHGEVAPCELFEIDNGVEGMKDIVPIVSSRQDTYQEI